MNPKKKIKTKVISQTQIAEGIYDMWIETDLAATVKAGQFICFYPHNESTLLPRPISVCEADREGGRLRIVYRVAGQGTAELSGYHAGRNIKIMGNLGNGFPLKEAEGKRVLLFGGGIGIPPLLQLAKDLTGTGAAASFDATLSGAAASSDTKLSDTAASSDAKLSGAAASLRGAKEVSVILGYRDRQLFLKEDLEQYAPVCVATEDGSAGVKGTVLDALAASGKKADVLMACGPMPMLRALKRYAAENKMEAFLSLEERMACGIGACLGCVCRTVKKDPHSHVNNARVCTEGPVFRAEDVSI